MTYDNPYEVPLPYHTRVKSYTEDGLITIEQFNESGQWIDKIVDRYSFEALAGGTNVFFKPRDYDDDVLLVCTSAVDSMQCEGCPCRYPHYKFDCARGHNDDDCPDECDKMEHEQRAEIDKWFDESHPIIIQDYMPGVGYGDISPLAAAWAVKDLLQRAQPHMLFEKFGQNLKNNFVASRLPAEPIKFRRYMTDCDCDMKTLTDGEVPK